jgi:hypothetical protein
VNPFVDGAAVRIDYTNHRGQRSSRVIVPDPATFRLAEVSWHPGVQWLIDALDVDKIAVRTFALKDIHRWEPVP